MSYHGNKIAPNHRRFSLPFCGKKSGTFSRSNHLT